MVLAERKEEGVVIQAVDREADGQVRWAAVPSENIERMSAAPKKHEGSA